ncbi:PREDICTED: uncharacterized protein LOC109477517 [Branchiostoma belcheri]|uniref:Uncharacterized protein LOC109477517 n=1 Tax=Branchiostoma belcheri TaxID=7741 RepID=A0A6P4ZTT2_BRABE|nr:PREDICTED: uncharacterized protein LOC109477517 [Branchiostoma belcheri]
MPGASPGLAPFPTGEREGTHGSGCTDLYRDAGGGSAGRARATARTLGVGFTVLAEMCSVSRKGTPACFPLDPTVSRRRRAVTPDVPDCTSEPGGADTPALPPDRHGPPGGLLRASLRAARPAYGKPAGALPSPPSQLSCETDADCCSIILEEAWPVFPTVGKFSETEEDSLSSNMARFVRVFLFVLLIFAASYASEMSQTHARRTRKAASLEESERTVAEQVAVGTVRNTSFLRGEATAAPRSFSGRLGAKSGTEIVETRAQRTAKAPCGRARCPRGGTGRPQRCPRRLARPGPPVVHLYMRYLTWRSNWQPGGERWRQQALRNSTVYQVLPWKVSWRRGVGNFKFKVDCHVSKVNVVRESELVLTFSTTFQSAVRKGILQPPYQLVLLKVIRRSGVRKHRHLATKTVYGNETAPWVTFSVSRPVQTWRRSSRLKHGLRLHVVSMATGLQVDQRVARRVFDTAREATLLAAYVLEGGGQQDAVFSQRSGGNLRRRGKGERSRSHSRDRISSLDVLQRMLLGNQTGREAAEEEERRGPELLRDWLAYRGRNRQVVRRHDNNAGSEGRGRRQLGDCRRYDHYVVFDDVVRPNFILQPRRYNARRCGGACGRPLPDHVNATNHAMLMALQHDLRPRVVPAPCCVPLAYSAISVMEKHGDDIVVKPYPNMRVETCGCR